MNIRFKSVWLTALSVPIISVKNATHQNKPCKVGINGNQNWNKVPKKDNRAIFGIIDKKLVITNGAPSYASTAQKWNGATANLNKKAIKIKNKPKKQKIRYSSGNVAIKSNVNCNSAKFNVPVEP